MYQLSRLMRGNARSFAPIMIGIRKLPSTAGNRRDQEEEDHHHAVHGEHLVVGLGRQQVARRRQQLEPDEHREEAADEEEDGDRREIQQRDALVVLRQQPRLQAVAVVQVVHRFHVILGQRGLRRSHELQVPRTGPASGDRRRRGCRVGPARRRRAPADRATARRRSAAAAALQ